MSFSKIRIKLLLLNVLLLLLPPGVLADDFKLIPSIAVREEYNDNIFGSSSDTVDDFITTISPGLELIQRTDQLDLKLLAIVSPFFYADTSALDDVDQKYFGRGSYQISELLGINADAGYNVSNRPDRDAETTGLVESNDKRKRQDYGIGFNRTITEINAMALSARYAKEKWDDRSLDRQDLETYSVVLNYTHNLSQWVDPTIGRINFGFGRYNFETSDTYNYYTSIGAQHWFTETINLLVDLGVRYTNSDFFSLQPVFVPPFFVQTQIVETNNKSFGGVGTAILEIQGEITRGSFRIAHDIRPASGRGTTVQRTDAVFNLRRRLAERSAITAATGYYKNKADGDEFSFRETNEDTFFFRTSIRWEFYENFTLEAGYNFSYTDDRIANDDRRRNLVYLQLAYGLPLFE
jgi:hypothetical protein